MKQCLMGCALMVCGAVLVASLAPLLIYVGIGLFAVGFCAALFSGKDLLRAGLHDTQIPHDTQNPRDKQDPRGTQDPRDAE